MPEPLKQVFRDQEEAMRTINERKEIFFVIFIVCYLFLITCLIGPGIYITPSV
jgi:hypothetical protein